MIVDQLYALTSEVYRQVWLLARSSCSSCSSSPFFLLKKKEKNVTH